MGGRVRGSMGVEVGELLAPRSLESHCSFLAMRRLPQLPLFTRWRSPISMSPISTSPISMEGERPISQVPAPLNLP